MITGAFKGTTAEATLAALLRVHLLELLPAGECQRGIRFLRLQAAEGQHARLILSR